MFAILMDLIPATGVYPPASMALEASETEYYGRSDAATVIKNLNYTDISGRGLWSEEAVYYSGALGIVSGTSPGRFGRTDPLTKEEAIAIAYRAAGKEAEAKQLGEEVNNGRTEGKKTDPMEVLYDGFLQLAAKEGLITDGDLEDALEAEQNLLTGESFRRKGNATRQEMAYWLAMALDIQPVYQNQAVLNYIDWKTISPEKLPYLEAVLRYGIMNGSAGRINPTSNVTREQAAQIVKNAEDSVLAANGYSRITGTIEDINTVRDNTGSSSISAGRIYIRNADGKLAVIHTSAQVQGASGARNEQTGNLADEKAMDLVVYKNGKIGNSSLLEKGDRLQYIADEENTVRFVNVISNVKDTKYLVVEIDSVDSSGLKINVTELFETDYPDLKNISGDISFSDGLKGKSIYRVSASAQVYINGEKSLLKNVSENAAAILTIGSDNIVRGIKCIDIGINSEAMRVVRGIVEENNPGLGYITLYNEDGSGTSPQNRLVLRTYNYADQNKTEILRNHKPVKADSIQPGDTVYIKLDEDGNIASLSAVDNYTVKYGKILSKLPDELVVEYEDGTQQVLSVGKDVIVIQDGQLVGFDALRDGDRVRLLLNENSNSTDLKEITIEGDEHYISRIYKGKITKIDEMTGRITVMGLQAFNRGNWERTETKGFTTIPMADSFSIYSGDTVLDIETANRLMNSNEAYIAVEKSYGGIEKAVVVSYKNSRDTTAPVKSDIITRVISGSGSFLIARGNQKVNYNAGSIVVKYGRLVSGNSLSNNDEAYLALERDYSSGAYYASVVQVDEPQNSNGFVLYRGRIKAINEEKDFTVESFSLFQGTQWYYFNTPKTFNITMGTRILIDNGVLNVRDFTGYGEENYLNRTVYILADDTDAVLVSTAPYGSSNLKGTVYRKNGQTLELRNAKVYNPSTYMWDDIGYATINVLENTVIIKNGKSSSYSEIGKGTEVRILKSNNSASGDGYVIFVE